MQHDFEFGFGRDRFFRGRGTKGLLALSIHVGGRIAVSALTVYATYVLKRNGLLV